MPTLRVLPLVALTTVATAGAAELASRLVLPPPGSSFAPGSYVPGLLVPDTGRGYGYASNYSGTVRAPDHTVRVTTNAMGLRTGPILNQGVAPVLAIGDSYTAGWGVDGEDAWPTRLEQAWAAAGAGPHSQVVNAGVSGYGLHQIRRLAEDLLPVLRPRAVVLGLYAAAADRIEDPYVLVAGVAMRRSASRQVRLVRGRLVHTPWHRPWLRELHWWSAEHFWVGAHLSNTAYRLRSGWLRSQGAPSPTTSDRSPTRHQLLTLLRELNALAEHTTRYGVPLVVVPITRQDATGRLDSRDRILNQSVRAHLQTARVLVYDPVEQLEDGARHGVPLRLGRDEHWSPEAHAIVARGLAAFLADVGILAPDREPATKHWQAPEYAPLPNVAGH